MHLSLRNKLLAAFGGVLSITLLAGVAVLFLARANERSVRRLATEDVPAVSRANELERHATRMSADLREYEFTDQENHLAASLRQIAAIKDLLRQEQAVGRGSARAAELQRALAEAQEAVEQCEQLSAQRQALTRALAEEWTLADQAGAQLVRNFSTFLTAQRAALKGEIDAGLEGDQLGQRLQRIELASQALALAHELIGTRWQSQAARDMSRLGTLPPRFDALDQTMAALLKILDWEKDKERLAECRAAAAAYRSAMQKTQARWEERNAAARRHEELATRLNAGAEKSAQFGLTSVTTASAGVVGAIGRSVLVNLSGLALATVAGVVVALLFSRWIVRTLQRIATSMRHGARHTADAAGQVSEANRTLAERASRQADSLGATTTALDGMSGMTRRNVETAQRVKELGGQARHAGEGVVRDMDEMNRAMQDIKASSDDTAKIVKTIDEIAFQTNILALNAAVEAARAGDAGLGFAVVADEVRNLAQRAAAAARETASKIETSVQKSARGAQICGKVSHSLAEIVAKTREVDELAAGVATASREQEQGIGQLHTAVTQMDQLTRESAASAGDSAAAADSLQADVCSMEEAARQLVALVDGTAAAPKAPPAPAPRSGPPPAAPARAATPAISLASA